MSDPLSNTTLLCWSGENPALIKGGIEEEWFGHTLLYSTVMVFSNEYHYGKATTTVGSLCVYKGDICRVFCTVSPSSCVMDIF